jgi:2-iminoacetate synthase ThiH
MAGAADVRPTMSVEDIERICASAGFTAVERDTHYNEIK